MTRGALAFALLAALGGGCGGDRSRTPTPTQPDRPAAADRPSSASPPLLEPVRCPTGVTNCRETSGRVVFVERVDPDGDGDAHFVLLSRESITAPGITIVDVRRDLRPHPLPGVGDQLGAAGPVFPGSRGQRQIEAVAVETSR